MRKLLLGALLLLSTLVVGQDRINDEKFKTISTSKPIISAIGWSKHGEWVSNKNVIYHYKLFKDKTKYNSEIKYNVSSTSQNFISMFFKKIIYKDTTYYCLYITKWDGAYEYPSIYQNWQYFKAEKIHIFTEEEYKKLLDIQTTPIILESKKNLSNPLCKNCGSQDSSINYELKRQDSSPLVYKMIVKKSDDGQNIRFQLPNFEGDGPIYWKNENLIKDLDSNYFEISLEQFNSILIQ